VNFKPYPILTCVKITFIHYEEVVDLKKISYASKSKDKFCYTLEPKTLSCSLL
jgi:hypothetical protein